MNVEGLKNDAKATPLHTLPPPLMTSHADGAKVDGSTDVLNYDDILRSMDNNKPAQAVEQEEPLQEYYEEDDGDDALVPETSMTPRHRYRRHSSSSRSPPARRRRSPNDPKEGTSFVQKYKHLVLVVLLVGLVLYFGLPKLYELMPGTFVSMAKMSPIGVAIATAAVGGGFFVGDTYVLSKI